MSTALQPARFMFGEFMEVFTGYTNGETFNGWAIPYYTIYTMRQLAKCDTLKGCSFTFNDSSITISDPETGETHTLMPEFMHTVEGGKELYKCGCGWEWDELSPLGHTTRYHAITVRHLGATDKLPARIKLMSYKNKESLIIPYTSEPGSGHPSIESAVNYLLELGFVIVGNAEYKSGDFILLSETFKSIHK